MPGTLDEALDFLAAEYDVRMPAADLLYSNPYEALMTSDTTGGWVDVQQIGGRTCDHLAYRQASRRLGDLAERDDRGCPARPRSSTRTNRASRRRR